MGLKGEAEFVEIDSIIVVAECMSNSIALCLEFGGRVPVINSNVWLELGNNGGCGCGCGCGGVNCTQNPFLHNRNMI